jgi:hypothetical protein
MVNSFIFRKVPGDRHGRTVQDTEVHNHYSLGFSLKIRDSLNEFPLVLVQVKSQPLENILFSEIWQISPSKNRLESNSSRIPMK